MKFPIFKECDAVVLEGSFAGIAAALECASAGQRVILVEPRTYLGREMTAYLRPWLRRSEVPAAAELPPVLPAILTPEISSEIGEEIVFHPDRVKRALEDLLLAAGVQILYAAQAVELWVEDGALQGVVLGSKAGRQAVRCATLLDSSATALAVKLADPAAERVSLPGGLFWRTIEFSEASLDPGLDAPLPDFLGVPGGRFTLHRGIFNERHWLVEFPIAPAALGDPHRPDLEAALQEMTTRTASYLLREVPAFAGAYFAWASFETPPLWRYRPQVQVQPDSSGGFAPGIYTFNPNPASTGPLASAAAGSNPASWARVQPVPQALTAAQPSRAAAQVIVAGGGTSGLTAAVTAGGLGMRTVVLEMNPRLGGTGTIGGVQSYWFGREAGFNVRTRARVEEMHRELRQPLPEGNIPRWNIEAKSAALLRMARENGVQVEFNVKAIGVVMDGRTVRGVIAATPDGVKVFEAQVVIDATGDGDIAAFAGAETAYGAARNRAMMWFSLAQFVKPGQTQNNFTSMVNVSNVEDITRAVLSGRRRGPETVDHGAYLALRESRRVCGEVEITLTDQLRQKQRPDVINIAFSNHDIKGHTDSDWVRAGLIPPNLEIEIPLGAILPQGLENLLVVGKALSATHDALPAIRMQRDLENLGGAAATAAALAVRLGVPVREAPIRELQCRLVEAGTLPPEVLTREIRTAAYTGEQIEGLLAQVDGDQPLSAYQDMEMDQVFRGRIPLVEVCCAGPEAVPVVREAYAAADGNCKLRLAQMLALMGDAAGVPELIRAIEGAISAGRLPERGAHIRNTQLPPDQGAAPEVVYWLYSLGMTRDERAVPVWERVAEMLLEQACVEDFYSQAPGTFTYIDAVCFGAERLGSPRCAAALENLARIPGLSGAVCTGPYQADYVLERLAFLELSVARARLCCGLETGLRTTAAYLVDTRALLREHAYDLLRTFTGKDFPPGAAAWLAWIEREQPRLEPRPDRSLTEAQREWA